MQDTGKSSRFEAALHTTALTIVGLCVAGTLALDCIRNLFSAWPNLRLGFSGLLAAGLPLYPTGSQPAVGDIYGPMAAIFYLPPLWAPNITADVLLAEAWTILAVGGVVVVPCLLRGRKGGGGLRFGASVALIATCVMLGLPGLRHCLVQIHADAPSIVFGALSCLVWRDAPAFDYKRSFASAVLFGLALWSKQSALPIVLGQLVVLAWRFGLPSAVMHAFMAGSTALALFFGLCAAVGTTSRLAWFYMVTVPRKHALQMDDLWFVAARLLAVVLPVLALAGALAALRRARSTDTPDGLDWRMLAAAGFATAPLSWLATLKVGGYLNNVHAHYYLLLACAFAVVDRLGGWAGDHPASKRVLGAATLGALLLLPNDLSAELLEAHSYVGRIDRNPHQLAYDYLVEHDDAYFPWHPLSVVEAQGRVYTSFDALRTLAQARVSVSPAVRRAYPRNTQYVVLPDEGRTVQDTFWALKPDFAEYVRMPLPPHGLSVFAVYAKP